MAGKKERERRKVSYGSAKTRAETHTTGFGSKYLNQVDGFPRFKLEKPKSGIVKIDIIPYIVGKGNPFADAGSVYYERTFWIHRNVGPTRDSFICAAKTFVHKNARCPICEHQAKMRRDPKANKDAVKALNPSERQLFLVKDVNAPDEGIQIWDMSHHLFGKLLDSRVKGADDDENYENFFHLDGGNTLKLTVEEDQFGDGKPFAKVTAIDFKPRKEGYEESILDEVPCLDKLLVEPDYEKLKKAFYAIPEEDEEDEDEDDDLEKDDEEEDDLEEDEDEEDEPKKSKKKGKPDKKKSKKKEEDDEDEDDDLDSDDDLEEDDDAEDEDLDDDDEVDDEAGEEEEEEVDFKVGDRVMFSYKKKMLKGRIKKINKVNDLALVEVKGQERPSAVALSELALVGKPKEDLEEDEDEGPKKKRRHGIG